jgi:hypothetical protein
MQVYDRHNQKEILLDWMKVLKCKNIAMSAINVFLRDEAKTDPKGLYCI